MADTEVTIENTGERFACPADSLILDAGLAAGLHMPHNCRGGACGTCKCKVVEGQVDHGWVMSFAITDEEKAEGSCLACQSKPLSPTERRVLGHLLSAEPEKRIAAELGQSPTTAHDHVKSIYRKFGVGNRAGLMSLWLHRPAPARAQ